MEQDKSLSGPDQPAAEHDRDKTEESSGSIIAPEAAADSEPDDADEYDYDDDELEQDAAYAAHLAAAEEPARTVFADLGRAMGIAFLLIYFVLVARFRSFRTPLVVLAAVPLAMIGIMPGFALLAPFGIFFSATAMIGLIALIGIVVRNSIILIEFVEDKLIEGMPLGEALVESASARTRPIFLTAAAGVLSSVVIAFDPVWSGLAWALVFGMSASAVLSVIAVPLLYERIGQSPRALSGAATTAQTPRDETAVESIVVFPELGGFELTSSALPRVMAGEHLKLDADVYRGIADGVDAVAHLHGPFVVESAEIAVGGVYGGLRGQQRIVLRSADANAPAWRELERA